MTRAQNWRGLLALLCGALGVELQVGTQERHVHLVLSVALHALDEGGVGAVQVGEGDELQEELVLQALLRDLLVQVCHHRAGREPASAANSHKQQFVSGLPALVVKPIMLQGRLTKHSGPLSVRWQVGPVVR